MLSLDTRKTIVGFSVAIIMFVAALKTFLKPLPKADTPAQKPVNPEDVQTAITAYSNALADGVAASDLNDMNREFSTTMGLRVYQDSGSGEIVATDLSGNEVGAGPAVSRAA